MEINKLSLIHVLVLFLLLPQFIIGKKGAVGLTYEHTPAEGPPIANLMDHIFDFM